MKHDFQAPSYARLRLCVLTGVLMLCSACSHQELTDLTDLTYGNLRQQAQQAHEFQFRDQGRAIYFRFDKSSSFHRQGSPVATFLFVIAGSECGSMQSYLPDYFRGLEGESGPLRIFILHKRHIEAGQEPGRSCSAAFVRDDYPERWLQDQTEFILASLAQAAAEGRPQHAPPARVVVMGISEGAEIAPLLALRIPAVTHLVLLGNGGMQPLDSYRLLATKTATKAANADISRQLAALELALARPAPADPDAPAALVNGRSWLYWSQLRELRHTDNLLALSLPIFMGMGEADASVPVESAYYLQRRFAAAGKHNLSLHVYPGADHGLRSASRLYLPDFMHQLDLWLQYSP